MTDHAAMANELAYASADFYYGMALFNLVLAAGSIAEINNATKAYNTFNGLSEDAQKLLRSVKAAIGKRFLRQRYIKCC